MGAVANAAVVPVRVERGFRSIWCWRSHLKGEALSGQAGCSSGVQEGFREALVQVLTSSQQEAASLEANTSIHPISSLEFASVHHSLLLGNGARGPSLSLRWVLEWVSSCEVLRKGPSHRRHLDWWMLCAAHSRGRFSWSGGVLFVSFPLPYPMLGIKPTASHMIGKCCTSEPHPQAPGGGLLNGGLEQVARATSISIRRKHVC